MIAVAPVQPVTPMQLGFAGVGFEKDPKLPKVSWRKRVKILCTGEISQPIQLRFIEFDPDYQPPRLRFYTGLEDDELTVYSIQMHQWILEESLSALRTTTGGLDPLEIVEWIFSPDFIDWTEIDSENHAIYVRRHQRDIPFSFYNCCLAVPYDPDEIRSEFASELPTLPWIKTLDERVYRGLLAYIKTFS